MTAGREDSPQVSRFIFIKQENGRVAVSKREWRPFLGRQSHRIQQQWSTATCIAKNSSSIAPCWTSGRESRTMSWGTWRYQAEPDQSNLRG